MLDPSMGEAQRRRQAQVQVVPVPAHKETLLESVLTQEAVINSGFHREIRHLNQRVRKAMGLSG